MAVLLRASDEAIAATASAAPSILSHATNNLILYFLTNDTGTTALALYSTTFTVTIASPAVITYGGTADVFLDGSEVYFTTTGALPTGLATNTTYFVKNLNAGAQTFEVEASIGGGSINTSGTQSGVHTVYAGAFGWTMVGTQAGSNGARSAFAYKVATTAAHTAPVFSGANDDWTVTCSIWDYVNTTTPIDAWQRSDWGVANSAQSNTIAASSAGGTTVITPSENNCTLLYAWGVDTNLQPRTLSNDTMNIGKITALTSLGHALGYRQQHTAAAVPDIKMYLNGSEGGNGWVIAIRTSASGDLAEDCRTGVEEWQWFGGHGTEHNSFTRGAPSVLAASIGGIVCSATAGGTTGTVGTAITWGNSSGVSSTENVTLIESPAGSGAWVGASFAVGGVKDFSGKLISLTWLPNSTASSTRGAQGSILVFRDNAASKWVAYRLLERGRSTAGGSYTNFFQIGESEEYANSEGGTSTIDWTQISHYGILFHRISSSTATDYNTIANLFTYGTSVITGGGTNYPSGFTTLYAAMSGWGFYKACELQGLGQVLAKSTIQIGDGTSKTVFRASSFEFPPEYFSPTYASIYEQRLWSVPASYVGITVYASSSDVIDLSATSLVTDTAQSFTISASSAAYSSSIYPFSGLVLQGFTVTDNKGLTWPSVTFTQGGTVTIAGGGDLTNCTIAKTTSTNAALAVTANGTVLDGCTIVVADTSVLTDYHLELGTAVTSITLTDVTFTGTPATDKVHVLKTTGTVTITISGTTNLNPDGSEVTSAGAMVDIVAPVNYRGLNFTGLVNGSKVKVFTAGSQTVLYGTDSVTGNAFAFDDSTSGATTVDYTIQKAGYAPIRVTGAALNGSTVQATGRPDTAVNQLIDRAYVASSGLAYGTTAVVTVGTNPTTNPGTKTFTLGAASTGQNWYSFWIEQWIDKGDTGEALANVEFPLAPNGPNSFTLNDGWTFSDGATSIAFLSRDGLRYLNTSDVLQKAWAAILTSGVPSGKQVRYQQSDAGTTVSAVNTGEMDQLVQIYDVGVYDRRGYLVLKVQAAGYDQAESNVVSLYGNLEDQLYVVGLTPTANGVATGDPALTITISQGTYTEDGKTFSVKIVDNATPSSGTDILRELRYNFAAGGAYQGEDAFNWHDLVQTNGSAFKTVRGTVYGTATTKGVLVYENDGTTLHPDFTLFTADNGTTYAPVIPNAATATVLANTRVQLYNVTQAVEIDNSFVAGTSYSYTITTEADNGDTLRLRVCKKGREADEASAIWASAPLPFLVSQPENTVYTAWGIDGETVTEYSLDGPNLQIDANDVDGNTLKVRLGAFYSYALTTEIGIRQFFGAITTPATNIIRVNTAVANLFVENINPTTALVFTDLDVRLYKDDGTTIIAATSYSIHNDYSGVPDTVETGVSGLTGPESSQLMGLPSAAATATAVWSKTLPL